MKKMPRANFLNTLATMPDEAFGWLLVAITMRIWPDGLGGFQPASRASIVKVKAEATKLLSQLGALPERIDTL